LFIYLILILFCHKEPKKKTAKFLSTFGNKVISFVWVLFFNYFFNMNTERSLFAGRCSRRLLYLIYYFVFCEKYFVSFDVLLILFLVWAIIFIFFIFFNFLFFFVFNVNNLLFFCFLWFNFFYFYVTDIIISFCFAIYLLFYLFLNVTRW